MHLVFCAMNFQIMGIANVFEMKDTKKWLTRPNARLNERIHSLGQGVILRGHSYPVQRENAENL